MKSWSVRAIAPAAALFLSIAAACGGDRDKFGDGQSSFLDAGTHDAGVDAGVDAGAGAGIDAGADAGTDAGADAGPDDGSDAGTDGGATANGPDAGNGSCSAYLDYGTITTPINQGVVTHANGQPAYDFQAVLTPGDDFDYLDISLYQGDGVFTANGSMQPGIYQLTGAETQFSTCGLCVFINTGTQDGVPTDRYLATGGTVTITSLAPTFSGSVTNLTVQHVDINSHTSQSTPDPDMCTSAIDALQFSASSQ